MDEYHRRRNLSREHQPPPNSEHRIQFVPSVEKQFLQSISGHPPLAEVLNKICGALDCQIGNVVSLISLSTDDAGERAGIAASAALFGLYIFCSQGISGKNNEPLGSVEIYSCVPRLPSVRECQWVKRATRLAALAIRRDIETGGHAHGSTRKTSPMRCKAHRGGADFRPTTKSMAHSRPLVCSVPPGNPGGMTAGGMKI